MYVRIACQTDQLVARSGAEPVPNANPYGDRIAVTITDPDGFRVVLVADNWTT